MILTQKKGVTDTFIVKIKMMTRPRSQVEVGDGVETIGKERMNIDLGPIIKEKLGDPDMLQVMQTQLDNIVERGLVT